MESDEAFSAACIQLYSHIWVELETLLASSEQAPPPLTQPIAAIRLQVLRLELIVLIDGCDGEQWRSRLRSSQRRLLKTTLEDALNLLAEAAGEARRVTIENAQNRLLDAVLDQCSASSGERASRPLFSAAS